MKTLTKVIIFDSILSLGMLKLFKTKIYKTFVTIIVFYGCFILFASFQTALGIKDADSKTVANYKRIISKFNK